MTPRWRARARFREPTRRPPPRRSGPSPLPDPARRRAPPPPGGARSRRPQPARLAGRQALREVLRPQPAGAAAPPSRARERIGPPGGHGLSAPLDAPGGRPARARGHQRGLRHRERPPRPGSGAAPAAGGARGAGRRGPGLRLRLPESALRADRQAGGLRERGRAEALREGAAHPPARGPVRGPPAAGPRAAGRSLARIRGSADLARLQGAPRAPPPRALVREAGALRRALRRDLGRDGAAATT